MWFLNKESGLKWEVVDQELMLRLQGNANYEQVDDPKQETKQAKRNEKEVTT